MRLYQRLNKEIWLITEYIRSQNGGRLDLGTNILTKLCREFLSVQKF